MLGETALTNCVSLLNRQDSVFIHLLYVFEDFASTSTNFFTIN